MAMVRRARAGIEDAGSVQTLLSERFQDGRAVEAFRARLSADRDIGQDDPIWLELQLFAIYYDKMCEAIRGASDLFRAHEKAMTELTNVVGAYSDHGAAAAERIEILVEFVDAHRQTHDALLKLLGSFAEQAGTDLQDAKVAQRAGIRIGALWAIGGTLAGVVIDRVLAWLLR